MHRAIVSAMPRMQATRSSIDTRSLGGCACVGSPGPKFNVGVRPSSVEMPMSVCAPVPVSLGESPAAATASCIALLAGTDPVATLPASLPCEENEAARRFRVEASYRVEGLLDDRRLLCLPTTPIFPPRRDAAVSVTMEATARIVDLTCFAV